MSARTVIITGASDGIGAAAARGFAAAGDNVVVVGRSPEKTARIAEELAVDSFVVDFSRLSEVRTLAAELLLRYPRIDVLANNAGGLFRYGRLTDDGLDLTMQVNHLSPFLLTNLLLDTLKASHAKVINTSSAAARQGRIDLSDINLRKVRSDFGAYGASKLANVLFTAGLQRRFGAAGITAAAFHPGVVATSFGTAEGPTRLLYGTLLSRILLTPERGADTLLWLANTQPGRDWEPGGYFEKRHLARTNRQAYDEALIEGFWDESAKLVGLS